MKNINEPIYRGVFPVVPTTFTEDGALDLESQKRCVDFMIDAGSDGLTLLANYSEQFSLTDVEREILTTTILKHVAGRVPVIVTTSHFSSKAAAERSKWAQDQGACMVMLLPPYHGSTFKFDETISMEFFERVSDAISIPIMIQDAPVSGTRLSAEVLAKMAKEIENVSYFKIETQGASAKLRDLIRLGGDAVLGPWDGEEGITLYHDLEAGATGAMTGGGYPDGLAPIVRDYHAGRHDAAREGYNRWLPLINAENRLAGPLTCKILMKEGGIITSDAGRHPFPKVQPEIRRGIIETARPLDPMVLRWGK
jgi:2-keto-3-deoxy-L-arabinonate dehydratase